MNLNIALLTVPGRGGLNFDIDLQYASGNGVPASESPSWVGLGWNLTQYQITCNPTFGILGSSSTDEPNRISYSNKIMHDQKDIFYLSCPGISTQFQKFNDGNWYPLKWSANKITADNYFEGENNFPYKNHKEYKRFIVTDVNGTKYIFGMALRKNTVKRLVNHRGTDFTTTAYYYAFKLTAILASNYVDGGGDQFTPEDGGTDKGNWIKIKYTVNEEIVNNFVEAPGYMEINYIDEVLTPTHKAKYILDGNKLIPVVIGSRMLGYSTKCLDRIELYRRDVTSPIKSVNFFCSKKFSWIEQNSYAFLNQNSDYLRYGLDSISISGNDQLKLPSYKFSYNNGPSSGIFDNLPNTSCGTDGWGLITTHRMDAYPDTNQTDWSYWLVKDVTYPTGAKVSFVYESDRYIPYVYSTRGNINENKAIFAGGVRLKSKTIYDPQKNQNFIETYQYGLTNCIAPQAGFISCEPSITGSGSGFYNEVVQDYNTDIHYPDIQITRPDGTIIRRYYTCAFSNSKTTTPAPGSYFRYNYSNYSKNSSTITTDCDPRTWGMSAYYGYENFINSLDLGDSVGYQYTSILDKIMKEHKEFDDEPLRVNDIPNIDHSVTFKLYDNSWKRGFITREEMYSPGEFNETPPMPAETKIYYYKMTPKKTDEYRVYIAETDILPARFREFSAYTTSGWVQLTDVIVNRKPYTDVKATAFQYNTTNCLVEKEITTPYNGSNNKKIVYNCYSFSNYSAMLDKNMLSQKYFTAFGNNSSVFSPILTANQGIISLTGNTWSNQLSGEATQWNVDEQFNWHDSNGNNNFDSGENPFTKKFTKYDDYGNVKEVRDINNIYSSIKWGYNSAKPVGSFVNARYNENGICDFEDGTVGEWNYWSQGGAISSTAHTGNKGWYFPASNYGLITKRIPVANLNTASKYKFSGWVKSSSTMPNLIFSADNSSNYYSAPVYAKGTGNWEYVELILDLTGISGYTNIDLYARNGVYTYGECYWDDLRFYPINSICESYTFDNNSFQINSITDENNKAKKFNYDGLDRLINVYDENILIAEHSYNFSRGYNDNYSVTNPNKITSDLYQTEWRKITSYSFFDGIGRNIQTHQKLGSSYVISPVDYDGLNRPVKTFKPYISSASGFDASYSIICSAFYNSADLPFIENHYDGLSRIDTVYFPNMVSQNRSSIIKRFYGEDLRIETIDENGKLTVEKHDFLENKKSITNASGTTLAQTTNFHYDLLNRPIRVIDPLGRKTLMSYNSLGQLIKKTTPDFDGSGSGNYNDTTQTDFEYVYDKAGRLRFWRDADFKLGKLYGSTTYNWLYNKYDMLGRPIETGITNLQQTRSYIEDLMYTSDLGYEIDQYNTSFTSDPNSYTSNRTYPNSNKRHLSVNYYDNYNFDKSPDGSADVTIPDGLNFAQGRMTARYTNYAPNLSTNYNIRELFFYDQDGNICEYRIKFPLWYEKTMQYQYDLQGKPTKFSYQAGSEDQYFVWYDYDDLGRLSSVYSSNDDYKPSTAYAVYTYNASGKVSRLLLGGNVQGVDYRYNLRDWLTQINSKELTTGADPGQDGPGNGVSPDVFGELLGYDAAGEIASSHADFVSQKNGNISWLVTSTKNNSSPSATTGWVFKYDDLNRLTLGNFGYLNSSWYTSTSKYKLYDLNYDLTGNITSLKRNNKNAGVMDNLSYTYNVNRLTQLTDAVSNTDSLDAETSSFTYDANGNMLTYSAKGITSVTYNHQNLPLNIQFGAQNYVKFYYDASGNRVYKGTASSGEYYIRDPKGNTIAVYDKDGNIQFFNLYGGTDLLGKVSYRY